MKFRATFLFFFNTTILALLVKVFFFICLLYFLSLVDKGAFDINEHIQKILNVKIKYLVSFRKLIKRSSE